MSDTALNTGIGEAHVAFSYIGELLDSRTFGSGHINDTFLEVYSRDDKKFRYVLQRINKAVFPDAYIIMKNISGVTEHIRRKVRKNGGDYSRCTLNYIPDSAGSLLFVDSTGYSWRMYEFVENTVTSDKVEKPEDFYRCARAFGNFQMLLSDYPADELYEVIENFHNTPKRYEAFENAVKADVCSRAYGVADEIAFVRRRKDFAAVLENAHAQGRLPLRVTHNDTKLNNILFDAETGEPVCIIDLDTVMPGYSVTDFGDSIRFGANTATEDEKDLSFVSLDLELFGLYAKGFLEGCGGRLTPDEVRLLPDGAKMMTFECGMRFLTDYLSGDTYFRTAYEGHNLDRCRTQFRLLEDMERKTDEMNRIIEKLNV